MDPKPVETPAPQPAAQKNDFRYSPNPEHAAGLRTFSSDLAKAVKDQQGSVVKIAIAEEARHRAEKEAASPVSRKNLSFITGGVILVGVAIVSVGGLLWYRAKETAPVPIAQTALPSSIIRADSATTLDITGKGAADIATAFRAMVTGGATPINTAENVLITETAAGATPSAASVTTRVPAADFLSALGSHESAQFSRALSEDYELGIYNYDHSNPFLVLEGTAHDYLLSGMLSWEPYLVSDIGPLFGIDPTTDAGRALAIQNFQSTIIENRDARAVLNPDGTPALFYSFLNDDTIIIAADPATLTEAVRRFAQQ